MRRKLRNTLLLVWSLPFVILGLLWVNCERGYAVAQMLFDDFCGWLED